MMASLRFPRGAEIQECENINNDWFWGCYCGRKGLFPGGYDRDVQGFSANSTVLTALAIQRRRKGGGHGDQTNVQRDAYGFDHHRVNAQRRNFPLLETTSCPHLATIQRPPAFNDKALPSPTVIESTLE